MTNYTKTMREALQSMYISEDNIAILRDIVKRKSAMPLKFADGKMKVDLFTASAVTQALDKVNPANKAKITKMINTGKKANFMSVAKVVMKSENDPEIEEEEVKVEEVSLLAQQAAILISKRELERNPRKEEVELDEEKMPSHAELVKGKYGDAHAGAQHFSNIDGKVYTWNYLERKGGKYVVTTKKTGEIGLSRAGSKDFKTAKIVKEEVEIKEGKFKKGDTVIVLSGPHKGDPHKIIHDHGDGTYNVKPTGMTRRGGHLAKIHYKLGAATAKASDLKKEEVELDELMPPSRHVGKSKKNPDMFCVFDTNGKEVKLFKDEDDAKEYAVKNHDALMGHDKPKKEEDELDEGKMNQLHQYIKDKKSAEEIAKLMKVDVKTIKTLMSSNEPFKEEAELDEGKAEYTKKLMKSRKIVDYVKKQQAKNQKIVAKDGNKKIGVFGNEPRFDSGTMWGQMAGAEVEQNKMSGPDRRSFDAEAEYEAIARKLGLHKFEPRFYEEAELDEGQLKDMLAQAGDIEYYAKRSGGIDKKDMMKAASLLKKGNKSGALNFVSKLDTSPREKILDLMGEEVEESYEFGTDEYTKHTKDVTPGQGKEIDEARPSARRDAMKAMGKRGKDSADDDDYVATADDRKAADKNIIMQLRKATNLGGKYEVTFKDKKKVKVKPEIAMAFIKKFEKMKPVDKAKLQDKGSKSYKDLLKGLKEEDTSMLGRIEKKLKEIKNG